MKHYTALWILLFLAACGLPAQHEQTVPAAHYDCEGHVVDMDPATATATLRRGRGDKIMRRVASESGAKYAVEGGHEEFPAFIADGEAGMLMLKKRNIPCVATK